MFDMLTLIFSMLSSSQDNELSYFLSCPYQENHFLLPMILRKQLINLSFCS